MILNVKVKMMPLSEPEIRAQVERQLRKGLSDEEWALFVEMGSVGLVEDGEAKVSWLVGRIRDMLARITHLATEEAARLSGQPQVRPQQAKPRDEIFPSRRGDTYVFSRQDALSLGVAVAATKDPEVVAFRHEVLVDCLLTYAFDNSKEGVEEWITRQVEREEPRPGDDPTAWPVLTYIKFLGEGLEMVPVAPGGILDRLRQLGDRLAVRYRWAPPAAVAFVLTDDVVPTVNVLTATIQPDHDIPALTRIELVVDPAAPPAAVARAYRQARNRIVQARAREMQPKTFWLAQFGMKRPAREPIPRQMAAWNEAVPDPTWQYQTEQAANFSRDRNSAVKRLLRPDYQLPTQEVTISYDDFTPHHDTEPDESA